jgi:ABC-type multidrug transport system ATPase subunit
MDAAVEAAVRATPSAAPAAAPLLECRGLGMAFGRERVLRGLDFSIGRGEIVALVGKNGAGKSTLFKILAGLIRSHEGSIAFDGRACPAGLGSRADVAFAFDEQALFGDWSAAGNIRLLAGLRGAPERRAKLEARTAAELPTAGHKRLDAFSHGMKKRFLAIVAEDLVDARLLVLDEPTNGLDYEGVLAFERALRARAAGGGAVFFTCHYLDLVHRLADRVLVLDDGRLAAEYRSGGYPIERLYEIFA